MEVYYSISENILAPMKETSLENILEIEPMELGKSAVHHFILPRIYLRYAGKRMKLREL